MSNSIENKHVFLKKYRRFFLVLLFFIPVINASLGFFFGFLTQAAVISLGAISFVFYMEIVAFLYGKTMMFSGSAYPNDGSIARLVFSVIFLLCFLVAQFIFYFI